MNPSTPSAGDKPAGSAAAGLASRRVLLGAGALAALAGASLAAWRLSPRPAEAGAVEAFWSAQFEGLSGGPVRMADFRGRPLLLNFWATWCPPCVQELPLLDRFHTEHRAHGWQVLGLAIDQPGNVRKFLERAPVGFALALAGLAGSDLGRELGNATGGLPFTVVFAADGSILARKMGEVTPQDLTNWAQNT